MSRNPFTGKVHYYEDWYGRQFDAGPDPFRSDLFLDEPHPFAVRRQVFQSSEPLVRSASNSPLQSPVRSAMQSPVPSVSQPISSAELEAIVNNSESVRSSDTEEDSATEESDKEDSKHVIDISVEDSDADAKLADYGMGHHDDSLPPLTQDDTPFTQADAPFTQAEVDDTGSVTGSDSDSESMDDEQQAIEIAKYEAKQAPVRAEIEKAISKLQKQRPAQESDDAITRLAHLIGMDTSAKQDSNTRNILRLIANADFDGLAIAHGGMVRVALPNHKRKAEQSAPPPPEPPPKPPPKPLITNPHKAVKLTKMQVMRKQNSPTSAGGSPRKLARVASSKPAVKEWPAESTPDELGDTVPYAHDADEPVRELFPRGLNAEGKICDNKRCGQDYRGCRHCYAFRNWIDEFQDAINCAYCTESCDRCIRDRRKAYRKFMGFKQYAFP